MSATLVRRNFLITEDHLNKLDDLSKEANCSATEIVRRAIDSYDPNAENETMLLEMIDVMSGSLKKAIKTVKATDKEVKAMNKAYREARQS